MKPVRAWCWLVGCDIGHYRDRTGEVFCCRRCWGDEWTGPSRVWFASASRRVIDYLRSI